MKMFNMNSVKEKCNKGIAKVNGFAEKLDDITVNPKMDASLTLKSKKSDSVLFNCNLKFDKKFSLLKIIYAVIAVIGAFITASVIVNLLFSVFGKKQKKKSEKSKITDSIEPEFTDEWEDQLDDEDVINF